MDFAFSEEQEAFREGLRRFVGERWPLAETRRQLDAPEGFDRTLWKQMAGELGLQGLAIPEAHGGQGFGFLELGIALEELGRELAGGPFLATAVLAARALLHAGDGPAQAEWLPRIASGDAVATLAWTDGVACTRDGARLRGEASLVLDGAAADLLLVVARAEGMSEAPPSLFAVTTDVAGIESKPLAPLDPTRRLARLRFEDAPAKRIGAEAGAAPVLARTLDEARIALAAEMVGGADRCLQMAVEHAKARVQFGRPIGSFQAIQHKAAEVLLELEPARSIAHWSWWVAAQPDCEADALAEAAALAKSACADAYQRAAAENIHIHGGMGVTWENDAHLYQRRAFAADLLLGDARTQRARLAALRGL